MSTLLRRPARPRLPVLTEAFVVRLARALHVLGVPAPRLEGSVARVAARLGAPVSVLSTPTAVQLAFERGGEPRVHLLRADAGELDLGKVSSLDVLIDEVGAGAVTVREGLERLAAIEERRPAFGRAPVVAAHALASTAACRFFGGGAPECAAAAGIAAVVGVLSIVAAQRTAWSRVFVPFAAFVASLVAGLLASIAGTDRDVVTLSALIVLVPGFTLTVAVSELAERHLVSGTARLTSAAVTFLAMGLGTGFGRRLAEHLVGVPGEVAPHELSIGSELAVLLFTPVAFVVLFQARARDTFWIVTASLFGFAGARAGASLFGPELGVFVGAFLVGAVANVLARTPGRTATGIQAPGIMLLVPGSLGFRSVSSFLAQDVTSGVEVAFRTFLVAVALVGGLLFANVLVAPRREL